MLFAAGLFVFYQWQHKVNALCVPIFLDFPVLIHILTYWSTSLRFLSPTSPPCVSLSVESLYTALKNIDRADIVTSLEGQAPQPVPGYPEEGACRLGSRDSTLLSPSVLNGKTP